MHQGPSTWTPERVDILKQLWAAGMSALTCALDLHITRNAVIGKVHRLGLSEHARLPSPPRAPRPKKRQIFHRHRPLQPRLEPFYRMLDAVDEPMPVPIEDQDIPKRRRRTFAQLEPHHCKWPVNHPRTPEFFFCGATRFKDAPYCIHHMRRSRIAGSARAAHVSEGLR